MLALPDNCYLLVDMVRALELIPRYARLRRHGRGQSLLRQSI